MKMHITKVNFFHKSTNIKIHITKPYISKFKSL